jgi:hypothetical protein
VLEVGCGDRGGLVEELAEAGYDAVGVDPRAPHGPRFRQLDYRDVDERFDAAVAVRVLHHVQPLDEGVAKLAELAPLLVVDEFAPDLIVGGAQRWYEEQHRLLRQAGADPGGPHNLDEWRAHHHDLHPHDRLLAALRSRYEERALEWEPYFHRWLHAPEREPLERAAIAAGEIPAVAWRWAGERLSAAA